jgi:hypothetical protein
LHWPELIRRWFQELIMNITLLKIEHLLKELPDEELDKGYFFEKAKNLSNECGCFLAGVFLFISIVMFISYVFLMNNINLLKACSIGLLFIFFSAVTGKLLGIGIAKVRLLLLYKLLLKQMG